MTSKLFEIETAVARTAVTYSARIIDPLHGANAVRRLPKSIPYVSEPSPDATEEIIPLLF